MRRAIHLLVSLAALTVNACQPETRCDKGYVFNDGQCLRAPVMSGSSDAGANDGGGPDVTITFGTPCRDGKNHSDCQSATTSVCLIYPDHEVGQCSAVGCNITPAICPTGWSCFDLSTFQPGAPFGCVPF